MPYTWGMVCRNSDPPGWPYETANRGPPKRFIINEVAYDVNYATTWLTKPLNFKAPPEYRDGDISLSKDHLVLYQGECYGHEVSVEIPGIPTYHIITCTSK
jgi:hypothetical protein